ncbi:nuclease-related domain-containing protein [Streptomyces sp. NPDC006422]|uniref:nuclease-related domain-containing protein n=1 Tax=unclassified Streptomyces TaxID=2593676 RepID=UPI0033B42C4D
MSELSVNPWKRHGRDRLYVNLPDGTAVAWADRITKEVTIKVQRYRQEALELLRQHLGDSITVRPATTTAKQPAAPAKAASSDRGAMALPPLTVADDLAGNPPGAGLMESTSVRGPSAMRRLWDKARGRSSAWDSYYVGLAGERRVGRELERLRAHGWHVLHGLPNGKGGDIDHLLIGTGGVFSVNTKRLPGSAVWVGDSMAKVNGGPPQPYAAAATAEAALVRKVLERHCGFPVPVEPALVFVDIASLDRAATQYTVHVYEEREVSALGPLSGAFTPEQVERLYAVARHRRAWVRG